MRKALVTGGGGFVGSAIARRLLAMGVETVVLGRHRYEEMEKLGARMVCGDIRAREFLIHACKDCDTVFHVAAKAGIWGDKHEYDTINVQGTFNVLEACWTNKVRNLVYTSTPSVVFNRRDISGADETLSYATRFLCHYAATKAEAEKMVLNANSLSLKTCAIRPHLVWGPGDPHLIPRLIDRGKKGLLKQVGTGKNLVDISYIDNVADAHILAAENLNKNGPACGQAYFISQGEPVNLWTWINDLFARLGVPPVAKQVGFGTAYIAGGIMEGMGLLAGKKDEPAMTRFLAEQLAKSHWFSIDKARQDLGYTPGISTPEGLDRLIAWLQDSRTGELVKN